MQWISCHEGRLLTRAGAQAGPAVGARAFGTGLDALDALAPGGAFARGAIHELLSAPSHGKPLFVAMLLARAALETPLADSRTKERPDSTRPFVCESPSVALIWSDPHHEIHPPALAAHGIPLEQVYLLRTGPSDQVWAVAECLRCKGVGAVVAAMPRLTRVEARRLQLAAEAGGGAGIFLRAATTTMGNRSPGIGDVYAAATRWLVRPAPGERTTQRWGLTLLHGHGGRIGHAVTLEYCRENHLVRALAPLADRPSRPAQPVVA
jgi:protein ImuA